MNVDCNDEILVFISGGDAVTVFVEIIMNFSIDE